MATAASLTERDLAICDVLAEHRVATSTSLAVAFFDSLGRAQLRLSTLHRRGVLDRFRPQVRVGSAPYYYVLGPAGLEAVRAAGDRDVQTPRSHRGAVLRLARSKQLAHLVETNAFFLSLLGRARRSGGRLELVRWWSERVCAEAMAGIVRPDGYGVWRCGGDFVELCYEHDRGTETISRVVAKLDAYRRLEAASGVSRWVLLSFPTARREAAFRSAASPAPVKVATTSRGVDGDHRWWPLAAASELRLCLEELNMKMNEILDRH